MDNLDYDFIGFTYNGVHSIKDLGVYRVSNNGKYEESLTPSIKEITASVDGMEGEYYFGNTVESKAFSIQIAFEKMSEKQFKRLKQVFNGDGVHDLIFDEMPYKIYSAKVTGRPVVKYMCFEKNGMRYYNGNATINFTCYHPYAHTPRNLTRLSQQSQISIRYSNNNLQSEDIVTIKCGLFLYNINQITLSLPGIACIDKIMLDYITVDGKKHTYKVTKPGATGSLNINFSSRDIYIDVITFIFYTSITGIGSTSTNYSPTITDTATSTVYRFMSTDFYSEGCFVYSGENPDGIAGKNINLYPATIYPSKKQWAWGVTLDNYPDSTNKGEINSPFIVHIYNYNAHSVLATIRVHNNKGQTWGYIKLNIPGLSYVIWDSKIGLAKQILADSEKVLAYEEGFWEPIPAGEKAMIDSILDGGELNLSLEYNYWYY